MAKDLLQQHLEKFKDSFQNGLNTIQQAVHQQSIVGGSNFYPTTLVLQTALKSGWLKKLGNVMKLWQRRWFVIKGDNLYYYSSSNDSKSPQGCIFLPCCHTVEVTAKISDTEKFVFCVIPKESNASNQEAYNLAAESEQERMEWLRVIKKIIYQRIGGAIFGSSLEETLRFETAKDPSRKVPEIVEVCVEYITKYGLDEEGIFRLPGLSSLIKKYADLFDRGDRPRFDDNPELDVHTVASLLKLYLRELTTSIIPTSSYEGVVRLVMREMPINPKASMEKLRDFLLNLPKPNYNLLQYLCKFLNEVAQHSSVNKMNAFNLGTVFSTAFLRPEFGDDDAALMMATSNTRKSVTFVLIENQNWLFNVELTPFGGTVIVEDLLGLKFTAEDVIIDSNKDDEECNLDNNAGYDYTVNEDTFKDLLDIDFSGMVDSMLKSRDVERVKSCRQDNVPMRRSVACVDGSSCQGSQKTKELNRRGLAVMSEKDDRTLKYSIKRKVFNIKSGSLDDRMITNNNKFNDVVKDDSNDIRNKSTNDNSNNIINNKDDHDIGSTISQDCIQDVIFNSLDGDSINNRCMEPENVSHTNEQTTHCASHNNNNNDIINNNIINNNFRNNNCNNDADDDANRTVSNSNNEDDKIDVRNNFYVEIDNYRFDSAESLYNFVTLADTDTLTKADYKNLVLFLLNKMIAYQN